MMAANDFLAVLAARRETIAADCEQALEWISHNADLAALLEYLMTNRAAVSNALENHHSSRKLIANFFEHHPNITYETFKRNVPTLLLNVANLLALLQYGIQGLLPDTLSFQKAILESIEQLGTRWVDGCEPQIAGLAHLLGEIIGTIDKMRLGEARILVLELPVGNSLPIRILTELLQERGYSPELVKVSLSRNDSRKKGVTRQELMEERLREHGLRKDDLVVYLDEWISGSNFENILVRLKKIVQSAGAFILPAAILDSEAKHNDRYASYCQFHDGIASNLGLDGSRFRVVLPVLNEGVITSEQKFFWSEQDRLAGYRKMWHLGSVLGSIFDIVEELRTDQALFSVAHTRFLEVAASNGIENNDFDSLWRNGIATLRSMFDGAYPDYLQWKDHVIALEFPSNRGVAEDPERSLDDMSSVIADTAERRPAKICVALAVIWLQATEVDPRKPHRFSGHVPVISDLPDDLRLVSRIFVGRLMDAVKARLS